MAACSVESYFVMTDTRSRRYYDIPGKYAHAACAGGLLPITAVPDSIAGGLLLYCRYSVIAWPWILSPLLTCTYPTAGITYPAGSG